MNREKREAIEQALAAAFVVVNDFLDAAGFNLTLQDTATIKSTVGSFVKGARGRRVDWDWTRFYFKHVRGGCGYMLALRKHDSPVAMCLGSIAIAEDFVAIEAVERREDTPAAKGVHLEASYRFAAAVAGYLGIREVRVKNPLNERLATHYEEVLSMTAVRHPVTGDVQYLFRKVTP